MKNICKIIIILSFLFGCVNTKKPKTKDTEVSRSAEVQSDIDDLLARDAKNKKLELEYLEQIRIAQENNDEEAFKFFFQEYAEVERLIIPDWMKEEPNYFEGGLKIKY
jgi:hypothetical protein